MAVIQMTTEQLQQLIEGIRGTTVAAAPAAAVSTERKSMSNCSASFNGTRDYDVVESFITNLETFKDVEGISDEAALKGLSLCFHGLASIWWQGVRKEAKTWNEALELIRSHFSPTKPAYQIYQDIFKDKQNQYTPIDMFVCRQRALFAQLPDNRHDEECQLDFIYGLLNVKYRKKIARDEVKSFKMLLEKGRILEQTMQEGDDETSSHRPAAGKRCTFCNFRGHTVDDCRKRKEQEANNDE